MLSILTLSLATLHYLTCRHTFEPTLISELCRSGLAEATSPLEAVVRPDTSGGTQPPDPAYALQILPDAVEVRAASISGLVDGAAAVLCSDDNALLLDGAPRGSLLTHSLVPDLLRGAPPTKAKLLRRCETVAEKLGKVLRKRFQAARAGRDEDDDAQETLLLCQLLLLEPELLVVSLAPSLPHVRSGGIGYWPVRHAPGGYVDCTLPGDVPSSAYRKLLESFEVMHDKPTKGSKCVDLGACPGGWTAALRLQCDAVVTAVDRSPLAPSLMADDDVSFVQGDAFTFAPPGGGPVDWMVSDVIAYPERTVEMVDEWCREKRAGAMVVTMKFQGDQGPDFAAIEKARGAAEAHGYGLRCMHQFSNKNEVSLMIRAVL